MLTPELAKLSFPRNTLHRSWLSHICIRRCRAHQSLSSLCKSGAQRHRSSTILAPYLRSLHDNHHNILTHGRSRVGLYSTAMLATTLASMVVSQSVVDWPYSSWQPSSKCTFELVYSIQPYSAKRILSTSIIR